MRRFTWVALALVVLPAVLFGCAAVSPERRAEIDRAWAERDRERGAECSQRGGRYVSSSCLQGSGP